MRRWVRIVLTAGFYFSGVYFAVAALEPTLAWPAALGRLSGRINEGGYDLDGWDF
jgi:hypothetical protein